MEPKKQILEELAEIAPGLAGIKKEMPYKVPDGYFENLAPQAVIPKETPVRSISSGRKIFRYAAAAVVAGIIAVTVWYNTTTEKTSATLAKTESTETPQQLLQEVDAISDDEMEIYMEGNISSYELPASKDQINDEDINLMLLEISDKELETYLN